MLKRIASLPPNETIQHKQILEIMDESKMTKKQRRFWFLASGGTLLDGVSVMMLGISLHLLSDKISPVMMGLIGSALVLGAVFGSNVGGQIGDRQGRKKLLILNMIIIAVGALISAFSFSPWMLLAGQLVVGAGIGSDFAGSSTYVAEMTPRNKRSRLMVGTITFQSVGLLIAGILAWFVLQLSAATDVWRYFMGVEVLLAGLFLIFRFSLLESPRWLMGHGENQKATEILSKIFPEKAGQLMKLGQEAGGEVHKVVLPMKKKPVRCCQLLFMKEYRKRTILAAVPWFLMDIATYGIGLFTPVILASVMKEASSGNIHTDEIRNVLGTTIIDLFLLLGFLAALWLVPKLGRIKMQNIGFAGMAVGMGILFLATIIGVAGTWHTVLVFGGFIIFNLLMNAGPNATTFTLAPELFPTQLRSTASGFAAGCAKIGATLGIFILPTIKSSFGVPTVLAGMAVISLLGLLITVIYSEKIEENQTLEQRQKQAS